MAELSIVPLDAFGVAVETSFEVYLSDVRGRRIAGHVAGGSIVQPVSGSIPVDGVTLDLPANASVSPANTYYTVLAGGKAFLILKSVDAQTLAEAEVVNPDGLPPAFALGNLADVDADSPSNGEGLIWNSSTEQWEPGATSATVDFLDAVGDVNAPAPGDGQVLAWDDDAGEWVPVDQTGGGGAVDSVNGQTGVVVLDAGDVGADPAGTAAEAVSNHAGATDPHGDRTYTDNTVGSHTSDTTNVHGITDTANIPIGQLAQITEGTVLGRAKGAGTGDVTAIALEGTADLDAAGSLTDTDLVAVSQSGVDYQSTLLALATYVLAKVVDSAPEALDTLNELAAALADDPDFATTVTNALAGKAALSGAAFTGAVSVAANDDQLTVKDSDGAAPVVNFRDSSNNLLSRLLATTNLLVVSDASGDTIASFGGGTAGANQIVTQMSEQFWVTMASGQTAAPINVLNSTQTLGVFQGLATGDWQSWINGSSSAYKFSHRLLTKNITAVGNVGSGEDDLQTYTLPANYLYANRQHIESRWRGQVANNGNAKTLKVYFGSTELTGGGVAMPTDSAAGWLVDLEVHRLTSSTARAFVRVTGDGLTTVTKRVALTSQDFTATNVVKVTGEATSNNDIQSELHQVYYIPSNA